MIQEEEAKLKRRAEMFMSLPVSDWHQIIAFEKVIKNYMKMKEILKTKQPCQKYHIKK